LPEGDSIFRAARGLQQALAGRTVSRFESVFPRLTNPLESRPLVGQVVDRVEARGKHLLIWFSGGWVLRTHMRMHGSWHIYRPGERWQRPRHDMRIVLETPEYVAVAFNVPIAELATAATLERVEPLRDLGPDPLRSDFDAALAVDRIAARPEMEIADALLDQRAMAGIGNIYKSETLFAGRINPFTRVEHLTRQQIELLVSVAAKFLRANVAESSRGMATYGGLRQTTGRLDPGARFWVYGRGGKPCRRCGTPVQRVKQGPFARSTYWCPRCQSSDSPGGPDESRPIDAPP
jgi:endonuclease VIII